MTTVATDGLLVDIVGCLVVVVERNALHVIVGFVDEIFVSFWDNG